MQEQINSLTGLIDNMVDLVDVCITLKELNTWNTQWTNQVDVSIEKISDLNTAIGGVQQTIILVSNILDNL